MCVSEQCCGSQCKEFHARFVFRPRTIHPARQNSPARRLMTAVETMGSVHNPLISMAKLPQSTAALPMSEATVPVSLSSRVMRMMVEGGRIAIRGIYGPEGFHPVA